MYQSIRWCLPMFSPWSQSSPSPDWQFPSQKQDLYVKRTGEEIGFLNRRPSDLQMFEKPNNYFPQGFKPSHPPSCNFKNASSLDRHCKTTFFLKDTSPRERLDGPLVHAKSWMAPCHTTAVQLLYAPYMSRKAPSKDHIWFVMISWSEVMPLFLGKLCTLTNGNC
jgi:hypothetical protein